MVALKKAPAISHEEYLERERRSETRNEYHNGTIVAMTGARWTHNLITGRIARKLGNPLEGAPCEVVTTDQRVRVNSCNMDFYPDVVVVCGNPVFYDAAEDTILNPVLVVEVLSRSTEQNDRGVKWDCYRTLSSLHTYLLVSQVKAQIEIYSRTEQPNRWDYEVFTDRDGVVSLLNLHCELNLTDIYAGIELEPTAEETP